MKSLLLLFLLLAAGLPAVAAESAPLPNFSAPDLNPGSDRRKATGAPVSPRDYRNQVSAWYFGHEG